MLHTPEDQKRINALVDLMAQLFDRTNTMYLHSSLIKEVLHQYDLTFHYNFDSPENFDEYELIEVEKNDPINLFPVISNVLLKYKFKAEPVECSSLQERDSFDFILLRKDSPDSLSTDSIGLATKNGHKMDYFLSGSAKIGNNTTYVHAQFMGLVLEVTKMDNAGEQGLSLKRKRQLLHFLQYALYIGILSLLFGSSIIAVLAEPGIILVFMGLLVIKGIGIVVCINLYQLERSATYSSQFLEKFCTVAKKFSCKKVISSKASKLFGLISMSDIGLAYFSVGFLSLCMSTPLGLLSPTIEILFLLTLSALPYTFFSVYYQAFKIKHFCMMCLTVQLLLWVEFGAGLYFELYLFHWTSTTSGLIIVSISGLLVLIFLIHQKKVVSAIWEAQREKGIRINLLRNPYIFKGLIKSGPKVDSTPLNGEVLLGKETNPNKLMVVLDPRCPHCAATFPYWTELINWYPDKFFIQLRLLISPIYVPINKDILLHTLKDDMEKAMSLLASWYSFRLDQPDREGEEFNERFFRLREEWLEQESINQVFDEEIEIANKKFEDWHFKYKILRFPAIFINSRYLSSYYDDFDYIKYHLENI